MKFLYKLTFQTLNTFRLVNMERFLKIIKIFVNEIQLRNREDESKRNSSRRFIKHTVEKSKETKSFHDRNRITTSIQN